MEYNPNLSPRPLIELNSPRDVPKRIQMDMNYLAPTIRHISKEDKIPVKEIDDDPFWLHSRKEKDDQISRGISANKESSFAMHGRNVIERNNPLKKRN